MSVEPLNDDGVELSPSLAAQEAAEKGEKAPEASVEAPQEADTTEEATEQPETEEGTENASEEDKPKKRGKSAEQRIDELTRARREAERRADELASRLARLEQNQPASNDDAPKAPNPEDYDFGEADPKFIADMVDYRVNTALAERTKEHDARTQAEARQQQVKAQGDALDAAWKEKAAKGAEKYEDFEDVVSSAPVGVLTAAAISGSDVGEDIAYHLGSNSEDARELAEAEQAFIATRDAMLRLGANPQDALALAFPHLQRGQKIFERIEKQYKEAPKPKAKVATDAPEPPQDRVRGASGRYETDFASENCDLSKLAQAIRGR